ncbi:MAG: hypothetical protein A3J07_01965 [Candidatus Doudnabacteria bacterium RIFCSPLOWO2_02_FULL_49_13]|uniref:Uncharacterized protein n=1 Tax=Candidatus Doudnabacteria bacterium RIFCSPHIGHO2_12_FULL_48_16 TaxID=1817838 RepID=A0A1F5PM08_9BACT|nr:MAG: hypothetical protein A3B77_00745 [Candidatus Doudnabacteria bacterium RIFCSPHIGHO2_02_FULL_49_24]OGE88776.1 MAG: hypothetical protein A2760_01100 [Candidatus Doudnabacteria bacterium RIFCSPHIGHO2_01_FULL_50_67]OGE90702.1 MAG: hypothetical protein A3E29_01060 [Candidatus Doudnabacteria bacterium RIFCSPHIGHO2_12_FULL_48_16]OGE97769.1 MAG: hypothetical protein A2990_03670 [Candidatus Doudnabacteria bacterium RIFCSPLOWO2_01_FULL_49_40]OGF02566.1 MAG: hypothetical protein A3J07_01965 [Candid
MGELKDSGNHNPEQEDASVIIHVDRNMPLMAGEPVGRPRHPELANTGPSEYDSKSLQFWSYTDDRTRPRAKIRDIYNYFKDQGRLADCGDMRDLKALLPQSVRSLNKDFQGKAIFFKVNNYRR